MDWKYKFYFFRQKESFLNVINTIPPGLDPIVFILDSSEVWTNGHYFQIGYPDIVVSQDESNVIVNVGNSQFSIQATGEGLSIVKGTGNTILFNSNALSSLNTDDKLSWDPTTKKISHTLTQGQGLYGSSSDEDNASIISVPYLSVDNSGHITLAKTVHVTIRDYVKQQAVDDIDKDRNILIAENDNTNEESGPTVKANGLQYNDKDRILKGQNADFQGKIIVGGDVQVSGTIKGNVEGNVTGTATPTNHADITPKYGAGTSAGPDGNPAAMYGHVKLKDSFDKNNDGTIISPDGGNTEQGQGVAASPLLVYNGMNAAIEHANGIAAPKMAIEHDDGSETNLTAEDKLTFSNDFTKDGDKLYLNWEVIN